MPKFLRLSNVVINSNAIRSIAQLTDEQSGGEGPGCLVYFVGSPEPYAFYGSDYDKIMELEETEEDSRLGQLV